MTRKEAESLIEDRVKTLKKSAVNRIGQFGTNNNDGSDETGIVALHKRKAPNDHILDFQKRADDLFIVSTLLGCKPQETKMYKSFSKFMEETELSKAMTTTGTGTGKEWIPTDFSNELIELVQIELRVAALFPRINMPSDPFIIPGKSSFSTARLGVQSTQPNVSAVGTTQVNLATAKLIDWVPVSYELDEDSIIAMLPIVKDDIANAIARAQENATLNGDNSVSGMLDSDLATSGDDQRRAFMGLRKYSVANGYTMDLSTFNANQLSAMMGAMGKYGVSPSKLAWVVGSKVLGKLRVLADQNNFPVMTTLDKLGPRATILTGMVGELFGAPVVASEFVREDLNASGVYDGITSTYSCMHLVRTDGFLYGDRRKLMVEQFRDIKLQNIDIVASARVAFQPRYAIASNKIVMTGVKIS